MSAALNTQIEPLSGCTLKLDLQQQQESHENEDANDDSKLIILQNLNIDALFDLQKPEVEMRGPHMINLKVN